MAAWTERLRRWLRRDEIRQRDLDRELRSHLALEEEDFRDAGMTDAEARRLASVTVGNIALVREDVRAVGRFLTWDHAVRDLTHAVRMLRREWQFTASAVLTLALGVGVNTTMLGLVDALMYRAPEHVSDYERLVDLGFADNYVAYGTVAAQMHTIDAAAVYDVPALSLGDGADATGVRGQCVTESFFSVLGTPVSTGRPFTSIDNTEGAEPTLILSDALWRSRFSASADIIGRRVTMARRLFTVVGVAPPGFRALSNTAIDVWTPLAASPAMCSFTGGNLLWSTRSHWLNTFGRLRIGVTVAQANAELASLTAAINDTLGDAVETRRPPQATPIFASRRARPDGASRVALWLAAGAVVVLLIACANVAGLLSLRAIERRREIVVRLQLGATRSRLVTQLLIENLVLAALCGVVAVGVAVVLGNALREFFPILSGRSLLDSRGLTLLWLCALIAGVVSAAIPALQVPAASNTSQSRGGRQVVAERSRIRAVLIVAQLALSLTLVVATGLFVRSVEAIRSSVGYDLDRVLVAAVDFEKAGVRRREDVQFAFDGMIDRVRRLPQVESVALTSGQVLGLGGGSSLATFLTTSMNAKVAVGTSASLLTLVSPTFFATLGHALVRGHTFSGRNDVQEVIVGERMASALWPGADPIGKCAFLTRMCLTVVGVSRARQDADGWAVDTFFEPLNQTGVDARVLPHVLLVRLREADANGLSAVAGAIRSGPSLPFIDVKRLEDLASTQAHSWRLGARMFGLFGVASVTLAAIGLYALLAFSARRRTAEIGLRMALGARPFDIVTLVGREGLVLVAAGLFVGGVVAMLMAHAMRGLLFGVTPDDPATFAAASAVVTTAGLLGALLPARRASRVDPSIALRNE